MERNCELRHFGIKGQKWGVRRWQNEDGTLTEEGKAHYMTAARSGKLNYKKLSDADLDKINNRFNKENQFKRNVDNYRQGLMSTKIKKAAANAAVKGAKNVASGGKGIAGILAKPISDAFKDAFKFDNSSSNGSQNNKNNDKKKENKDDEFYNKYKKTHDFVSAYDPKPSQQKADEERGKKAFRDSMKNWKAFNNSSSSSSEDVLRNRHKPTSAPTKFKPATTTTTSNNSQTNTNFWDYYASHCDRNGYTHFAITRVGTFYDELIHYGIKGQKWGVRRYQNEDGTLTEAGKARIAKTAGYGYLNPSREDRKKGRTKERDKVGNAYSSDYWKHIDGGMDENEPSDEGRKLWDKYKTKYASATLKDLNLLDTPKARREVKRIFAQIDSGYKYDSPDIDDFGEREKKAATRRKELEHPKRSKATKAAVTAGKATKVVADSIKVFV